MSQRVYGSPIDLSGLSDGPHALRFYSDDNVENEESMKELMFYLDKINPETQLVVIGDQHEATYYYVSSRTTFELPATDNKAGVAKTSFSINKQDVQTYTTAFSLPNELGLHSITYNSEDNVRNRRKRNQNLLYGQQSAQYIHRLRQAKFLQETLYSSIKPHRLRLSHATSIAACSQLPQR